MLTTEPVLPEAERELLPSDADVEWYATHGWYLSNKLLTDEEVDQLVAASDAYYAGARSRHLPYHPSTLAYWRPGDGDVHRHNDYVHYESDAIAAILSKPLIGAVAARLAGVPEVRLFQSTMIYKPPRPDEPSNIVPWHFDRHYWQNCTSDRMLTAFIPFHDCAEPMGTLTMVDGSHRWREIGTDDNTTRHFAHRDPGELDQLLEENAAYNNTEVVTCPLVIPKGHMSFHHCRTYHGSGPNRSDRPRRAISLHLQDGDNRYRPVTLADGTALHYNHDHLVRRTPEGEPDYADPEFCPVLWRAQQ